MNQIFKKTKKIMMSLLMLMALSLALTTSCTENSNPVITYNSTGKTALIVAVENNDGLLYDDNEVLFEYYKQPMLSIFSELFGIPVSQMEGMSLNDIVETYGEPWQLNEITKFAAGKYDTIITMRNSAATLVNLENYMKTLSDAGYTLDMEFCLHGSDEIFSMYNHEYCDIASFASFIKTNNINLRMLYQTCCDAGPALAKWSASGIYAVNGAVGLNSITLFSPGYFMQDWVSGMPFEDCVNDAFARDIEKIGSFNDKIPVKTYLLTDNIINQSKSLFAGRDKRITFKDFTGTAVQ